MAANGHWTGESISGLQTDWSGGSLGFGLVNAPWKLSRYAVTTIMVGEDSTLADSDGQFKIQVVQDTMNGDAGAGILINAGTLRPGDSLTIDSRELFFIAALYVIPVRSDGTTTDTSASLQYSLQGHSNAAKATN